MGKGWEHWLYQGLCRVHMKLCGKRMSISVPNWGVIENPLKGKWVLVCKEPIKQDDEPLTSRNLVWIWILSNWHLFHETHMWIHTGDSIGWLLC